MTGEYEDMMNALLDEGYRPIPTEAPTWLHPLEVYAYWRWFSDGEPINDEISDKTP